MSGALLQPVRSVWRTLGWPAVAGALALAAAAVVASGLWPGPQADPAPTESALRPHRVVGQLTPVVRPTAPVAERLADLLELALREGVQVQRTEQRPRGAGESGTQLHMPARGSYQALRRFTEAALRADAGLALESLRLRRDTPTDAVLDADFVWWLAGEAP